MRSNIALLLTVLLTLGAGVVVGRLSGRLPSATTQNTRNWLAEQLHLSDSQRQQMDAIWADTRSKMEKMGERRHQLESDRDKALSGIISQLPADQQQKYNDIYKDYRNQRADLDKDREIIIHDAADRSKALLTDEQKKDWDNLTKNMHEGHGHFGPNGGPNGGPPPPPPGDGAGPPPPEPEEHPTTLPATSP